MSIVTTDNLLSNTNILIVDDTYEVRVVHQRFLKKFGATVEEAKDGQEALDKALVNSYQIILMDLTMPMMSGYEAASEIRKNGFNGVLLAFTAYDKQDVEEKCLEAGFDDCCSKFMSKEEIVKLMIHKMNEKKIGEKS